MGLMGDLFRDFQAILDAGIQQNEQSPPTALTYRYVVLVHPTGFSDNLYAGSASTASFTNNSLA